MMHIVARHHLPRLDPALAMVVLWGGLAVAVAVYDIGRWISAW
jgi:hypothetical protein